MMARRSSRSDEYRSTGWCHALGGARSGRDAVATVAANREIRSARMDDIINRYLEPKERG